MKFKEFLKEDPTATLIQWLEKHMSYYADLEGPGYKSYPVEFEPGKTKDKQGCVEIVEDGKKIIFEEEIDKVFLNFNDGPFMQPPGNPEWDPKNVDGIGLRISNARINDWSLMPQGDITWLSLRQCTIDTWKGIGTAFPVVIRFEAHECEQIKKNILHIFKMPYLDRATFDETSNKDEASKAFGIMQNAMNHSKSVMDFQNDLIDANLDDWAQP